MIRMCAALLALAPATVLAAPLLRCQIDQGGNTKVLEFTPSTDPYRVKAIDINGRFRFKAVVIGDANHVEYIKLYTYSAARRQPVLLHEVNYLAPVAQPGAGPNALTGIHSIYSPQLEREMHYGCALLENAS
ncbi:MAG: hypothetical protein V4508_01905 [Pseudomonadota bacterium]